MMGLLTCWIHNTLLLPANKLLLKEREKKNKTLPVKSPLFPALFCLYELCCTVTHMLGYFLPL